jgi:hypothetical protein
MSDKFEKTFAAISGHFLTEQLPTKWQDVLSNEELEEWFVECAVSTYEYWDWKQVYAKIAAITETVLELEG